MQLALHATPLSRLPNIDDVLSRSELPIQKGTLTKSYARDKPLPPRPPPIKQKADTKTKMVEKVSRKHSLRSRSSKEQVKPEPDRDSLTGLAKFLRTESPPPGNFMSLPENSRPSAQDGKSPFNVFRRQSRKKASAPALRTMMLPDSAVAAKTTKGHWHIAISIPLEHDRTNTEAAVQSQQSKDSETKSSSTSQQGPITVFKPVLQNVRPKSLDGVNSAVRERGLDRHSMPGLTSAPLASGQEATKAVQPDSQESIEDEVSHSEFNKDQCIHKPDSAYAGSRHQSMRSDTRQSVWTAFSRGSLESKTSHSRGQSSVSTAPSLNYPPFPQGLELSRKPSLPLELPDINENFAKPSSEPLNQSRKSKAESVGSDISSATEKVATTARGYGPSDTTGNQLTMVHKALRQPGPAPNKKLPDLPEGGKDGQSVQSRSSSGSARKVGEKVPNQWPFLQRPPSTDLVPAEGSEPVSDSTTTVTRQSRRERVKALRSRDMAQLRATSKYLQVMASVAAQGSSSGQGTASALGGGRLKPPSRQAKRRSLTHSTTTKESPPQVPLPEVPSQESALTQELLPLVPYQGAGLTLTPIMVVADLKPCSSNLMLPRTAQRPREAKSTNFSNGKLAKKYTLPGTITPSLASTDEEYVHTPRRRARTNSASRSGSRSLNGYQRAAALRRSKSTQDSTVDARLRKLEKSNVMMLKTINALVEMGEGFRELQKLWPDEKLGPGPHSAELRERLSETSEKGQDNVEPLMRELINAREPGHRIIEDDEGEEGGTEFSV
jgi:hypothetical protein